MLQSTSRTWQFAIKRSDNDQVIPMLDSIPLKSYVKDAKYWIIYDYVFGYIHFNQSVPYQRIFKLFPPETTIKSSNYRYRQSVYMDYPFDDYKNRHGYKYLHYMQAKQREKLKAERLNKQIEDLDKKLLDLLRT